MYDIDEANQILPKLITARQGDTVQFNCYAIEQVVWLFNGVGFLPGNVEFFELFTKGQYSLIIRNIREYNEGIYECQGKAETNKYFYSTSSLIIMSELNIVSIFM